jgi:SAM-dependent methyltransferase
MRELARGIAMKPKAGKAQQPSYDPYSSCGTDDSDGWVGPLPAKVVSVLDLTEDVHRSGIKRGMRVLELGCGVGDVSLRIAKLVGPTGLVVGVDESAERIDLAQKRATVAGQCYWTRFVSADLNTFIPQNDTMLSLCTVRFRVNANAPPSCGYPLGSATVSLLLPDNHPQSSRKHSDNRSLI